MIKFVNFNELGAGDLFLHGSTRFKVEEGECVNGYYNAVDVKKGDVYQFDADDNVCVYTDVEQTMLEEVPL